MKRILIAVLATFLLGAGAYAYLDEADITDKTEDGSIIKTDDGITWAIDPLDQIDTSLWMVGDTVIENDNSRACLYYQLINKDENNETACARKID